MPDTSRLRPQRRTDHLDAVGPAQQARHRQQHMRHQAGASTGPGAGADRRPRGPTAAGHAPTGDSPPPHGQHQLTGPQTPFDLDDIATYHDHGCLHSTKQRPSRPAKEKGGPLRFPERDQAVVAHQQEATRRQPL